MPINTETKKKIAEDWKSAFPKLDLYAQNKLYKVLGPLVIGIELIKLPRSDEYRPHYVVYSLWKENTKMSLDFPILLTEFKDKKNLQYNIPYERHGIYFAEVVESVRRQQPISFDGDISFKKVLSMLDNYAKTSYLSASPNSWWQALLQETQFKISLYISVKNAEAILADITKRNWDLKHFEMNKIDKDIWLEGLRNLLNEREAFLANIIENKKDKKIEKLPSSELVM